MANNIIVFTLHKPASTFIHRQSKRLLKVILHTTYELKTICFYSY